MFVTVFQLSGLWLKDDFHDNAISLSNDVSTIYPLKMETCQLCLNGNPETVSVTTTRRDGHQETDGVSLAIFTEQRASASCFGVTKLSN